MITLINLVGLLEQELVERALGDDIKTCLFINKLINFFEIVGTSMGVLDLVRRPIHYNAHWELLVKLLCGLESGRVKEGTKPLFIAKLNSC